MKILSKKNPIKKISSQENEIFKYNKDKLKDEEDLIKKNNDILKTNKLFTLKKVTLQKQLFVKNQEELLHLKEQELQFT